MPAEVIDLVSSDPPVLLFSSPPRVTRASARRESDSFLRLSDDFDSFFGGDTPAPRQNEFRRLTPPRGADATNKSTAGKPSRGAHAKPLDDLDSILLSSSPQRLVARPAPKLKQSRPAYDIFDDDFDGETPQKALPQSTQYSSRTAALLAELDKNRVQGRPAVAIGKTTAISKQSARAFAQTNTTHAPLSSIEDPLSQPAPPPAKRRGRLTTPEKEQRAREKAEGKENAATQRAAARAEKQKEKQLAADLAEVNKARHDKKISVGEMVLRMPEGFFERNIGRITEDVLKQLGVDAEMDSINVPSNLGDVLTWKRKVRARFDEERGHWVPLGRMEMQEEKSHVLCVLDASVFVGMVQRDNSSAANANGHMSAPDAHSDVDTVLGLDGHVKGLKRKWQSVRPIYLIEGLETFMRKSRSARNRNYQAAVRAQGESADAPSESQNKKKRKRVEAMIVDDDTIEDALLQLQVEHNCLIHHTSNAPETAEWIGNFTQHVSTIPYKTQQSAAEASFCMDVGQVRTGEDKDDTFVKMLQEIVRVTLPVAYGIATRYPTVVSLVAAMKKEGPLLLEDLQKCSNKNGSFTNARIGPALSKRVYKVFMGTDPDSMDV